MSELILAGLFLSGAWTQLDEVGAIGWLPLVVTVFYDSFFPGRVRWPARSAAPVDRSAANAAALLCALLLAHLALTYREEFGFGGDEGYHLSATRAFAIYFMRAGPLLAIVLGGYAALRVKRVRYAASIAVAALIAASYALPQSALFGRYPTAFYSIATPLNVLFEVVHSPFPYSANHIVNTLSVPAWLFVLRPLIIGRWPDWRVIPVALLIYFQPLALVYLASPLLEPWAFVLILLALEGLVACEANDRWIAVALCGIAACFKETAILLLPTTWLLACVGWTPRPALRPNAIAIGVAAAAPFVCYFLVRRGLHIERVFAVADASTIWTQARATEWLTNVRMQLGIGGLIAAAFATSVGAGYRPLWILTAIGLALFFFVDAASIPFTGYGRFLAYSMLAICGAVFAATYRMGDRALMAASAVILVLQLPLTARTLSRDFDRDSARNSLEWNGSLIRMPIRSLASQIPALAGDQAVHRLRVTTFATDLISVPVAYPDLEQRYTLDTSSSDCSCRDIDEAVIAGFEWPANFGDTPANRAQFDRNVSACLKDMDTTCARTATERTNSNAIVGAVGVGRR